MKSIGRSYTPTASCLLEGAEAELGKNPDAMRQRKKTVEHPYATIKHWMGSTHFLMKRLPNVQTEMSLHVLAYNLRRAINVLGVPKIIERLQAACEGCFFDPQRVSSH